MRTLAELGNTQQRATRPCKVIIVGAGMAGLVAADELLKAGHEPLILEARNRVGGRICTVREALAPGLHAEYGAMRIPRAHRLTMSYVERFHLPTLPFVVDNPQAYCYISGRKHRLGEVRCAPSARRWKKGMTPGRGLRRSTMATRCARFSKPMVGQRG